MSLMVQVDGIDIGTNGVYMVHMEVKWTVLHALTGTVGRDRQRDLGVYSDYSLQWAGQTMDTGFPTLWTSRIMSTELREH